MPPEFFDSIERAPRTGDGSNAGLEGMTMDR